MLLDGDNAILGMAMFYSILLSLAVVGVPVVACYALTHYRSAVDTVTEAASNRLFH